MCERVDWSVYSQTVEDLYECQIHIDVIKQSGSMLEIVLDTPICIANRDVVLNHGASITEFSRTSVCYADRLSSPATFDFV